MMLTNYRLRLAVAAGLIFCMMFSSLFGVALDVEAEELVTEFQLYVISDVEKNAFVGNFILSEDDIYVSEDTLCRIGNVESSIVIGVEDVAYSVVRGGLETHFSDTELLYREDAVYFPFIKTLSELCLGTAFYEEERVLEVQQCADLSKLEPFLTTIYKNPYYNMSGWQNQAFFYEGAYLSAIATDVLKNFNFISYNDPFNLYLAQKEQYQQAFWSILIPVKEDDFIFFIEETNEIVEKIAKYKGIADVVSEAIDGEKESGFLGDCGKAIGIVGDVFDYMQLEEIMELYSYVRSMGEMDESYMRGLELVLNSDTSSMNIFMKQKGLYALSLYQKETPVWEATLRTVFEGAVEDVEDKALEKLLGKICSLACDITNATVDSLLGTQDQVDATIQAHHILEIQKNCASYFQYHRQDVFTSDWEDEVAALQDLHDVMALYLRAGVAAYRALAIDEELEETADSMASQINADLETLAEYQEKDFSVVKDAKDSSEKIIEFVPALEEKMINQDIQQNEELEEVIPTYDFLSMNMDKQIAVLEAYYNNLSSEDGTYHINTGEIYEDNDYIYYVLRYGMSDEEMEPYLDENGVPMIPVGQLYVANICMEKKSGNVYEERVDTYGNPSEKTLILKNVYQQ